MFICSQFSKSILLSIVLALVIFTITSCMGFIPIQPIEVQIPTYVETVPIQPNQLQTYFPRSGDNPDSVLSALYLSSTSTLDIAIYSLTYPSIVKSIGDAYKRGVKVRVISDKIQAAGKSQTVAIDDLLIIGIPVKVNTHSGLMHLKMSIIDGRVATTGSYNYSAGATKSNDEMLVVISEPSFVVRCSTEFERLWTGSGFKDAQLSY
jgi:phosphatidylserine/phosphatidylglycerophosphate/cardiolipin synthase-like enzyme